VRKVLFSLFFTSLLLMSIIPADSILSNVFLGRAVEASSDEEILAAIRNEIKVLEKTGFGDALDGLIDRILSSGHLTFLLFYAEWCHFCNLERPIIDELEPDYDRIVFIRLDQAKNPVAMQEFGVDGFPTMFLIYGNNGDGYIYELLSGFKQKEELESIFDQVLAGVFSTQSPYLFASQSEASGCYPYHSCSFSTCYQNCILEEFEVPSLLDIERAIADYLKDCAGKEVSEDFKDVYTGVKVGKCAADCAGSASPGATPRQAGQCARCAVANTMSQLVGDAPLAKCVIGLWDKLGKLLEPHADCIAECAAPPQTWSKNWGHPCRPLRSSDRYECVSPTAKGRLTCIDCEWYTVQASIEECPFYAPECVNTATGPVCQDPCNNKNCNDGDPCTIDWCSSKEGCKHSRSPGCDKPDDSYDVSTVSLVEGDTLYKSADVGVLSNGFAPFLLDRLAELGEAGTRIDVSLQGIEDYPVLVVPSGGLSGLDSSGSFKSSLEKFVGNGGTLIVFSQQHGYEYQALPGGTLNGYGWLEDESCHLASAAISTYHPIFSGQTSAVLNVNVDGFFTSYPQNSTILLSRTKNWMPVMIMYKYGKGTVIATTLYSDMASALSQSAADEKILMRDLIRWAISAQQVLSYPLGQVDLAINVTNPYMPPLNYPVQEFNAGDAVSLSINVENQGSVAGDKVSFVLFDPWSNKFWVNVTDTVGAGQSKSINLTYQTTNASKSGLWSVIYILSSGNSPISANFGGEFTLNYHINDVSQYEAYVTIYDPEGNVVKEQNSSLFILPGATKSINLTLNAQMLGIWTARYSVLAKDNNVLVSTRYRFAVSKFKTSPDGFAYQDSGMTFWITSDRQEYIYGKNAVFTVHVKNDLDIDKSVTSKWSFPTHQWQTVTVPAHSESSFEYSTAVFKSGRFSVSFYEGDQTSVKQLGWAEHMFSVYRPSIDSDVQVDKPWYREGETVSITVGLRNLQPIDYSPSVTVRIINSDNLKIFENSYNVYYLPAYSSDTRTLSFTLPPESTFGSYSVVSDVYSEDQKVGSATAYFEIPKLPLSVRFDKPSYRIKEPLAMELLLRNYLSVQWTQTISVTIPDLAFSDSKYVTVQPGQSQLLSYNLNLPETLQSGKHSVLVNYVEEDVTSEFSFFVPASRLEHSVQKTSYFAGENVTITLENTGGIDTSYEFYATLWDQHLDPVFDEVKSGYIRAGETLTFDFQIPAAAVIGTYFLWHRAENLWTSEITSSMETLNVDGSDASLTSETDKRIYSIDEVITVLTAIVNLKGEIKNAILNLQILSTRKCVIPHDNLDVSEDTVLCPGVYYVDDVGSDGIIRIKADGVTIEGNNTVIIETSPSGYVNTGVRILGFQDVTVSNIELRDFAKAIYLSDSDNNIIEYNKVSTDTHNWAQGIVLDQQSTNNIVRGNSISLHAYNKGDAIILNYGIGNLITGNNASNNGDGIYLWYSTGNTISNNTVSFDGDGIWLEYSNDNVITNNIASNSYECVALDYSNGNTVANNTAKDCGDGIYVLFSSNNIITGNNSTNNSGDGFYVDSSDNNVFLNNRADSNGLGAYGGFGMELLFASNSTLRNNTLLNNKYGFDVMSDLLIDFVQDIDTSNTIDGKPIYYLVGASNVVIDASSNAAFVGIVNSINVTVKDLTIANNGRGVVFANATYSSIQNVTAGVNSQEGIIIYFSNNNSILNNNVNGTRFTGIEIYRSDNNTISGNTVGFNPYYGIYLKESSFNTIFNNTVFKSVGSSYGVGIYLKEADNNSVTSNYLHSNNQGITVFSSSYNELKGNNASSNAAGIAISAWSDSNVVTGNSANNNRGTGITLSQTLNNNIADNEVSYNGVFNPYPSGGGIFVSGSSGNNLSGNTVNFNAQYGIQMEASGSNILRNNQMTGNKYNFATPYYHPGMYSELNNDIDTSNLVDGKPIYYLVDKSNIIIDASSNAGIVYCVNCSNVTVRDSSLTHNWAGIYLYNSSDTRIQNSNITNNDHGVFLYSSSGNNQIIGCNVSNNDGNAIYLIYSNNNTISNTSANLNVNGVGIDLLNSNNNTVSNCTATSSYGGISLSSSNNNTISNNTFCSNINYDIFLSSSVSSGDNNRCTTSFNWNDEGTTGCTYPCPAGGGSTACSAPSSPNHSPNESSVLDRTHDTPLIGPTSLDSTQQTMAPYLRRVTRTSTQSHATFYSLLSNALAFESSSSGSASVIWEQNITLDVTDVKNILTNVGKLNATGKLYLYATLYSSTGQIIATSVYPFYITDTDLALTMETDKTAYTPGETVTVTGAVENRGAARNVTLTVKAAGTTIYSQNITLAENATYPFTTEVLATKSFSLEASVDGFNVTDYILVKAPSITASIIAPDVVGREAFSTTISIENTGKIPVNLNVQLGTESWDITIPAGELRNIQTQMTVSENTALTVNITGDATLTLQKDVIFGEQAEINVTPEITYLEGPIGIPFTITNTGILETGFNATFSINDQTVTKEIYITPGSVLADTVYFTLSKGMYTMQYASPFWSSSININVESDAEFIITSMPQNMTFDLGESVNLAVTVKNIGGRTGEAKLSLESPSLLYEYDQALLDPGQEKTMTFSLLIPDDVQEKAYKMYFEINGKIYKTTFSVQGAKISVTAQLDKILYEAGDNANLTLTVQNLRSTDLTLFSRVKLGSHESVIYYNLTGSETRTLSFIIPVTFDAGKLLYTIYMTSGRSLYINSLYVYPKQPVNAGIILYTDKQVYEIGENVTIHVDLAKAGTFNATAPNFEVTEALAAGSYTFNFTIPKLRSETYSIDFSFENFASSFLIDVVGYSARIINSAVDKSSYQLTDTLSLTLLIDVNRDFSGQVTADVLDPDNNVIGEAETNHTFAVGENEVSLSMPITTNQTGPHSIVFKLYAYGSLMFLSSGARYFDVSLPDTTPPSITHFPVTDGVEGKPIDIYALVTDDIGVAEVALYYRRAGETTYTKVVMEKCPSCIDTFNATIPGSAVTTATIEYYINATDGTNYATDPAANPTTNPHVISVNLYPAPVVLNQPSIITENSLRLDWTESTATDFKNYTIYQSNLQGNIGNPIYTITTRSTTSYDVTGLTSNTTYYFVIRVCDTGGLYADSNQVPATTLTTAEGAGFPWIPVAAGLSIAAIAIIAVIVFVAKRKRKREGPQTASKT
jgi:parallel beta-helix repeat protein